jgi:hypothetical protein
MPVSTLSTFNEAVRTAFTPFGGCNPGEFAHLSRICSGTRRMDFIKQIVSFPPRPKRAQFR